MNKLNCNIVRDLLPSYIEKLTNEKTAEEIKIHLCDCKECSRIYYEMTDGETNAISEDTTEINYLKKVKYKNRKILISFFAAIIFVVIFLFVLYGIFGISTQGYKAEYIYSSNDMLEADLVLNHTDYAIADVKTNECAGVVTIDLRSTVPIFKKDKNYALRLPVSQEITKVQTSNGQVLWENGEDISEKINDIYNAKVKYVGDNSAVSNLLETIDLCTSLKCEKYSIHLITDEKPYGLEIYDINLYDDMFSSFSVESYERKLKCSAYLILACIENADFVIFDYIAPNGEKKNYKLTVDEANEFLNLINTSPKGTKISSIKEWAENYWSLSVFADAVESMLSIQQNRMYQPYLEGVSDEIVELLNNNPIDTKYEYIHNNSIYGDMGAECDIYSEWSEAYEKQYAIICKAISDYAEKASDIHVENKEELIKAVEYIKNDYKCSGNVSHLYSTVYESKMGHGTIISYYYCYKNWEEIRYKTLQLAECAYFLGAEFEWIE